MIHLAYLSTVDYYVEMQELASGKGYADVVFIPRHSVGKPVMIVELKWNRPVVSTIQQIKERQYPDTIAHLTGKILLVGVSYDEDSKKHTCKIEEYIMSD